MNLEKFTIKSQETIRQAQQLAIEMENQAIEPGHLLRGLMNADDNVLPYIFRKLGISSEHLSSVLKSITGSYPRVSGGQAYLSEKSARVLQRKVTDTLSYAILEGRINPGSVVEVDTYGSDTVIRVAESRNNSEINRG